MSSGYEELCQVLHAGVSEDSTVRTQADNQLQQWEIQPGFHAMLQTVAADVNLDSKLRLLAVLTLKNGIDKYWRKTVRVGGIQPPEKEQIRNTALSAVFTESDDKIAKYTSIVVSKIARLDFPKDWPQLLEILVQNLQSSFGENVNAGDPQLQRLQHRSLQTLYLVVKALCSKMLPASRQNFRQLAPQLLQYTATIFRDRCEECFRLSGSLSDDMPFADYQAVTNAIQLAAVALKILRKVVVYGFKQYHQEGGVVEILGMLLQYLQRFLPLREKVPANAGGVKRPLNTILVQIGKVFLDLEEQDVASFVQVPSSMLVVQFYWSRLEASSVPKDDIIQEKMLIQSLRLLKSLLKNPQLSQPLGVDIYPTPQDGLLDALPNSSFTQAESPPVRRIVSETLLTPDFVVRACQILVGRYMILNDEERELWADDPEEWFVENEADRWEFSIRACAEKVFMDLISTNRALLQPVVMSMLQEASASPMNESSILLKDAVYCAVGLAAHDLYEQVDFESWFLGTLVAEASTGDTRLTILHRRIPWLISQWLPVQPKPALYDPVYRLLVGVLTSENDMVVRLTAVAALKKVVDDFGFELDVFRPFVAPVLDALANVMADVDGVDCLGGVVGCIAIVVERLQGAIVTEVPRLMHILPTLWQRAGSQEMFRASLLGIISKLIVSLRAESQQLHPFVIPILSYSVNVSNPAHVYLLEDGLDLWHAVVTNATTCSNEMHQLLPFAVQILGHGSESLKKILAIVECYVVLDVRVLQTHGQGILAQISETLGQSLRPEAAKATLHCLDTIVQATYPDHLAGLESVLVETQVVAKLIHTVRNVNEVAIVIVGCIGVLARLTLCDPVWMLPMLLDAGGQDAPTALDVWCEKVDHMSQWKQKRLTAIGLTSLCGTLCTQTSAGDSADLLRSLLGSRVPLILPVIASVLADTQSRKLMPQYGHYRHLNGEDGTELAEEDDGMDDLADDDDVFEAPVDTDPSSSLHAARRRQLAARDPGVWAPGNTEVGVDGTRATSSDGLKAYVAGVWRAVVGVCGQGLLDACDGIEEVRELLATHT
ncbi:Importin-11 [Thoreauomyces humboldtii]|nr:Importin-11 [Thoreauomyces humboldtii]